MVGFAGEGDGGGDVARIAAAPDEGGEFVGGFGSGFDGYAAVGGGESGGIVDAVTEEGDDPSARLKLLHEPEFGFGVQRRVGFREAGSGRAGGGIAGGEDSVDAGGAQLREGFGQRGVQLFSDGEAGCGFAVDGHEDEPLGVATGRLDQDEAAVGHPCLDAAPGEQAEGRDAFCAAFSGLKYGGERMARGAFDSGRDAEEGFAVAGEVFGANEDGIDGSEGSGFVEDGGIDFGEGLDGVAVADEKTACGETAGGAPEGGRGGEPGGAGAGDEQHGEGVEESSGGAGVVPPEDEGGRGGEADDGHEEAGETVGEAGDSGGARLSAFNGIEERGGGAGVFEGFEGQQAVERVGAGGQQVAGLAAASEEFAGHSRLLDEGFAVDDARRHGDAFARMELKSFAARQYAAGRGGHGEQGFEGALLRPGGGHGAERVDDKQNGGDFVVDRTRAGDACGDRSADSAADAEEEEGVDADAPLADGAPSAADQRAAQQGEDGRSQGGGGEMEADAFICGGFREVDGERQRHGIHSQEGAEADAEPRQAFSGGTGAMAGGVHFSSAAVQDFPRPEVSLRTRATVSGVTGGASLPNEART